MLELVDIGVNLTHARFADDRAAVVTRAAAAGVNRMVLTGVNIPESKAAARHASTDPKHFRSTAGIHPHHAGAWDSNTLTELHEIANDPIVAAIGEMGLDYNRDFSPRNMQRNAFTEQLALAVELNRPVFLHQRDAEADFLAILGEYHKALPGMVLHCFTGNGKFLERCLELNLSIGITGWICDERRGQALADCVTDIPLQQLMIETDAPFLLPRDLSEKPRNGRNEPAFLPHILERVACLTGHSLETIARTTTQTSISFFGF